MSSKIKVDTIENVAGSGNVSLGSGHNLVVPGDLTVDTNNLFVDASAEKVFVNRTTQTKNSDAFVVSSPAGGVGGGNNRVDMIVTAEDLTGDGGANANAFVGTKAKGTYYNGLEMSSSSGHIGGWIGNYGASASTRALEARVGGTGINASDVGAMKITVDGHVLKPNQPSFMARNHGQVANNAQYVQATPLVCKTIDHNVGSHYDSSNGRFTAPVAGKYMFGFSFGICRTDNNETMYPYFVKNSTQLHYQYWAPSGLTNLHAPISFSACINLAASDYLSVTVGGTGDWYAGLQETMIWGYLIG